jgi:hypothetical protein
MNYLQAELDAAEGNVVEVTLSGSAANVMLMDRPNFVRYRAGQGYSYFGGHFDHSPARVVVPRTGRWHLIVDLGGAPGTVSANYRIL